jgi:hypothetical protein
MDLVALAFTLLMQSPDPSSTGTSARSQMLADFSAGVLQCYHRTARYQGAELLERPWTGQPAEGVDHSALLRVRYLGVTGAQHEMKVAILAGGTVAHAEVVEDTAILPFNRKCNLAAPPQH